MQKLHDLNDMAAFAKVVQAGGFTAAANTLGLPKSNVSRRISRLENELGVRLLERTTRRLHLTEAGEIYFQHCQRMLEEANSAGLSITQQPVSPGGLLRVGASNIVGQQLITPLMSEFLKQYSDIQLQLTLTSRQIDVIEEGFDLSIQAVPTSDGRLLNRSLGTVAMLFYASRDYIHEHGAPTHPKELEQHNLLLMQEYNTPGKLKLSGPDGTKSFAITPRVTINDYLTIRQLATEGVGIALLPDLRTPHEEQNSPLIQVLPDWSSPRTEYYAIYPEARSSILKLKKFVAFMETQLKG